LYALVETRTFTVRWAPLLTQAGVNGLIGIIAFRIVELAPSMMQGRDDRRHTISRRRY
jgi:hypothetical protein